MPTTGPSTRNGIWSSPSIFLQAGTGGERFIYAPAVIEEFASKFAKKITLGGTPVRAAIAMHKLGHQRTPSGDQQRARAPAPPAGHAVCMQQRPGHRLSPLDHPVRPGGTFVRAGDIDIGNGANRIIYHSDVDNVRMAINEEFAALITAARVCLVSGFNAMHDRDLLVDRLPRCTSWRTCRPRPRSSTKTPASTIQLRRADCVNTCAQAPHHVSMNEDELQAYLGAHVDLLDPAQVRSALVALHAQIPAPTLVVHSMYWALAHGPAAASYAAALTGGVTMATTRFCHGDDFTAADYARIAQRPPNPAGARVAQALNQMDPETICCVPVAHVAQADATTVGLGDALMGGFLPALLT
ncbi:MAG: hypothetical protein R3A10_21025 [Caldilineaceae bacterium]